MGYTPAAIKSAVLLTKDGNTRPGQSQRSISERSGSNKVWKCLVLPGCAATPTRTTPWAFFALPMRTLMTEDFPTFGKPTIPNGIRLYF
mmetsp:Transcript_24958/g.54726  ORF Transcript_24958/g.54726 Transcript_24958/m.54726 type:complete len:89 (+) Transcript_24958:784-1050(+)